MDGPLTTRPVGYLTEQTEAAQPNAINHSMDQSVARTSSTLWLAERRYQSSTAKYTERNVSSNDQHSQQRRLITRGTMQLFPSKLRTTVCAPYKHDSVKCPPHRLLKRYEPPRLGRATLPLTQIPLGSSRLDTTRLERSTSWANAFCLCRALSNSTARHALHDELDWLDTQLSSLCNLYKVIICKLFTNLLEYDLDSSTQHHRCIGPHVAATNVCLELMPQPLPRLIPFFGGPSLPHLFSSSLLCQVFS